MFFIMSIIKGAGGGQNRVFQDNYKEPSVEYLSAAKKKKCILGESSVEKQVMLYSNTKSKQILKVINARPRKKGKTPSFFYISYM